MNIHSNKILIMIPYGLSNISECLELNKTLKSIEDDPHKDIELILVNCKSNLTIKEVRDYHIDLALAFKVLNAYGPQDLYDIVMSNTKYIDHCHVAFLLIGESFDSNSIIHSLYGRKQ